MTLRMYAERREIALQGIEVRLNHQRRDAPDGNKLEKADGPIDEIDGELRLEGKLDHAQRKRLLQIASRCWLYRTLSKGINIRITNEEK
jgi:uncharacterized OsmC-like protein